MQLSFLDFTQILEYIYLSFLPNLGIFLPLVLQGLLHAHYLYLLLLGLLSHYIPRGKISLRLYSFLFFSVVSFCCSDCIISFVLIVKLILSLVFSIWPLNQFIEYFFQLLNFSILTFHLVLNIINFFGEDV